MTNKQMKLILLAICVAACSCENLSLRFDSKYGSLSKDSDVITYTPLKPIIIRLDK